MSFDPLARHYRWMEFLLAGNQLQRCRTAFLDQGIHAESALLLGEGNGRFLVPFLQTNPTARVTCVEHSAKMIDCARRALARSGLSKRRVAFVQENIHLWQPLPESFDLLVSHFFLDCFTHQQLQALIPRLAQSAKPGALWLIADFQIPERPFLYRLRARILLQIMYAFFRVATRLPAKNLVHPDSILHQTGFRLATRQTAQGRFLRSDCWHRP